MSAQKNYYVGTKFKHCRAWAQANLLATRMDQLLLQGSWRPGAVHVA